MNSQAVLRAISNLYRLLQLDVDTFAVNIVTSTVIMFEFILSVFFHCNHPADAMLKGYWI